MQHQEQVLKFYHHQNQYMREKIKEIEFQIYQQAILDNHKNENGWDVNMLIMGPKVAGKTSFQQTLHKSLSPQTQTLEISTGASNPSIPRNTVKHKKILSNTMMLQSTTLKSSKQKEIKGLNKLTNINQNSLSINCHQITEIHSTVSKNEMYYEEKYGFTFCLIDQNMFFKYCYGNLLNCHNQPEMKSIDAVVICLPITEKIEKKQVMALGSFIQELQEARIQFWIIGTGLDKVYKKNCPKTESIHRNFLTISQQKSELNSERPTHNKSAKISLGPAKLNQSQSSVGSNHAIYETPISRFQAKENSSIRMSMSEHEENLQYIQLWRGIIQRKLNIDREDRIYCLENFKVESPYFGKSNLQDPIKNEIIQFYALKVLLDIVTTVIEKKKKEPHKKNPCC